MMTLQQTVNNQQATVTSLEEAVVIGGGHKNWIIQSDSGTYHARKAVSCLVVPEIGDKVLSVYLSSGDSSILAIIDRKKSQTTHLKFEGNVNISTTKNITMYSGEKLNLITADSMNMDADNMAVRTKKTSMLFDHLNLTGNEANHSINKIRVFAKYIETISETSKQAMKNSFRLVSGVESIKAGNMIQSIKNRFSVQSRQTAIIAEEDAKMNGKRVHLG